MVKDICFNNINATSENGCFISGDTPTKVSGVYFNAVNINLYKKTNYQIGVYDKRPCVGEGFIYDKTYGIYVDKATGVITNAFLVQFDPSFPQELYGGDKHGF